MPIECDVECMAVDQDEFRELDYRVTGLAFRCQNELGNLLKEEAYKREVTRKLLQAGIPALNEVKIRVSHGSFSRKYFCDLLVEGKILYELKSVQSITGIHQEQLLHYLFLTGIRHGKIINFRSPSVEGYFVSTHYTETERRHVTWDCSGWNAPEGDTEILHTFRDLIQDWGIGLHLNLYEDAIVHLLNGKLTRSEIGVANQEGLLSVETWPVYGKSHIFHLSSVTENPAAHEASLRKFLSLTSLPHLHWINIHHRHITCKTLSP